MDNGITGSALLEPRRDKPERVAYTVQEVAEMLGVHVDDLDSGMQARTTNTYSPAE